MAIGSGLLAAVVAVSAVATSGAVVAPTVPRAGPDDVVARPESTSSRWAWPLTPHPEVVRRFDRPDQPWMPGHRGVDLAASVGQPVQAPAGGKLSWTGVIAGRSIIVVSHDGGLRSTFEPVAPTVPVGTTVTRGEGVGTVTASPGHCAPRTCLHWGVLRGETYLDPLVLVGPARVVLLPLP